MLEQAKAVAVKQNRGKSPSCASESITLFPQHDRRLAVDPEVTELREI